MYVLKIVLSCQNRKHKREKQLLMTMSVKIVNINDTQENDMTLLEPLCKSYVGPT